MRKAFKASRLMGLLALAFGLMAFSATAAQAENGSFWLVGKLVEKEEKTIEEPTKVEGTLEPQIQATLENNDGTLLTKVGLSKVEILCTSLKYVNGKLHEHGGATGKIHFGGCTTKLNGTLANACVPHSPGAANGLLETNPLKGLVVLHTPASGPKIPLLELLPETGEVFVTIQLGKQSPEKNECAIGEKFDIKGKEFLKDAQGEGEVNKVTHLAEEGPLSALLFGANPATLDGSANNFLEGAPHEGRKFSGIPG